MPHTTFSLKEVAEYLHLPADDVSDLVRRREIPFERMGDRVVFRRREVDAWASQRILRLTGEGLRDYHQSTSDKAHRRSRSCPT